MKFSRMNTYLQRIHSVDSLSKYNEHKNCMKSVNTAITEAMDSVKVHTDIKEKYIADTSKEVLDEKDYSVKVKAEKGNVTIGSVSSQRTKNSTATQKRAKAEAAEPDWSLLKRRLILGKRMAALEEESRLAEAKKDRIKAEYNADLSLLAEEKEVAAADAEASYLESESGSGSGRYKGSFTSHHTSIPVCNTVERTRQYVAALPDFDVANKDNVHVLQTEREMHTNFQNPTVPIYAQTRQSVLSPKAPPVIPHEAGNLCTVETDTEALTTFLLKKDVITEVASM